VSGKSSVSKIIISVVMPVGTAVPNVGHLIIMSAMCLAEWGRGPKSEGEPADGSGNWQ